MFARVEYLICYHFAALFYRFVVFVGVPFLFIIFVIFAVIVIFGISFLAWLLRLLFLRLSAALDISASTSLTYVRCISKPSS